MRRYLLGPYKVLIPDVRHLVRYFRSTKNVLKMTVTSFAVVVVWVTLASSVRSHPWFQQQIPNGAIVPNPCNRSTIWMGVGHRSIIGGGTLNPFGIDFRANNFFWNLTICQKDSDGDGYSNGYELGDPNCTWSIGQTPSSSTNLTHPGICEPIGSTKCTDMMSWLTSCASTIFDCPATNEPDVQTYTMRFPISQIPSDDTNYICNRFTFPNDTTTDIIALEPFIDNLEILHHMQLFGCNVEPTEFPANETFMCSSVTTPTCSSLMFEWIFGELGECLNSQVGFRIGPGGFRYALLQLHWNNPQRKANLTDSSGITLYYTPKLRPNRGETLGVGQYYLNIPPGIANVTEYADCSSSCLKSMTSQSIYLTSAFMHMHLLGRSGNVVIYRNGEFLNVLEQIDLYDYKTPPLLEFDPPIEIKPGDSIKLKCVFDSTGQNTTTYFGPSTWNEMCFVYFTYYPQIAGFRNCGSWKGLNLCATSITSDSCDLTSFLKFSATLPTLCASSCMNSSCVAAVNATLMTGCQHYDDVQSFLQTSAPALGSVLEHCSLAQAAGVVSSTPGTTKISHLGSHCSPLRSSFSEAVFLMALIGYAHHLFDG